MPLVSRVLTVNTRECLCVAAPLCLFTFHQSPLQSNGLQSLSQRQEFGICPRRHFILVTFIPCPSPSSPKSVKMEGELCLSGSTDSFSFASLKQTSLPTGPPSTCPSLGVSTMPRGNFVSDGLTGVCYN